MPTRLLTLMACSALLACGVAREMEAVSAGATACTSCHGDPSRASEPLTRAAPPASTAGGNGGAHLAHLGKGVACGACHVVPTSPGHTNGVVEVQFSGVALAGGAAPAFAGATCSGVYCHGATLGAGGKGLPPTWSGGPLACDACHGAPPPSHAPTSTRCNACHPGTVKADGTIDVAGGLHANGHVEAGAGHATGWADPAQHGYSANLGGLATCKGCHGPGLDGVGGTGPSCGACHATAGFASWQTTCTFCHGNRSTGLASPPVDVQGRTVTTNVSVGVHASHLGSTWMATPACAVCHPDRTGSNVITDSAHIDGDGVAEVVFGALAKTGGAPATYTRTSATVASCASVYCHGRFTGGVSSGAGATMSWTSTVQATCTSCHGAPPSTGHHGNHSGRSCGDCHPGYTTTAVNRTTHVDGAKQVGSQITSWNATTRTCTNTCHSSRTW